jgi:uncharacterized protein (TIGR03437 family)
MARLPLLVLALWTVTPASPLAAQTTFKVTPASLSFTYTLGQANPPALQTLSVAGGSTTSPLGFTSAIAGGGWLAVSPAGGIAPAAPKVSVNPSTLAVGVYSGTITVTTTESTPQSIVVNVTFTVKAPPPTLTATPSPMSFTWQRGASVPSPAALSLATDGSLISYSATAAGGNWLSISPKSGIAFPAFPGRITVSVNPVNLAPGVYKGTINLSAPLAANKSQTVTVNLTVTAGAPTITSIWPTQVTAGAATTQITITGTNFFSGSVVKSGSLNLSSTLLGPEVIIATVPASLLASAGAVPLVVGNAGAGGGDSSPATLTVLAAGPRINAIVNAASFTGVNVAPGEMLTIFGRGIGPAMLATFTPPSGGGAIATTLSDTRVLFDTTPAPVIYTSEGQVAVMTPYDVAGKSTVSITAEYSGATSPAVSLPVAAAAPGIFTSAGTGGGQAASFNFDETTTSYSLNTESAPAPKGSVVVFYATGEGVPSPTAPDGAIVTTPATTPNPALSLTIGGSSATILYSGGVVGLVSGILQINARVPTGITAGKAVPVVLTVNGQASPAGVTMAVK